ncbi:SH3 domain-containing protein [Streptomyces sp. NBC_01613]|uniref:SH3 domain-containing protein n=1 Tax=Streptomyces sp. NBC_01613 TaxID=2975896 RepID=UPI00386F18A8
MIRRTLRGGLVAAIAVVAVFPVAAVASAGPAAQAHAWNSTPPQVSAPGWQPAGAPAALPGVPTAQKRHGHHHACHHAKTHARRHHLKKHARRHTVTRSGYYRRLPYLHGIRHIVTTHTWGNVTTRHLRLNVRSGPGTGYRVVGSRPTGGSVALTCKVLGSGVRGNQRWYRLPHHKGYVSARYVHNRSTVRWC